MILAIEKTVKAFRDWNIIEAIIRVILMPIDGIVTLLSTKIGTRLYYAFNKIRRIQYLSSFTLMTMETYNNPMKSVENVKESMIKLMLLVCKILPMPKYMHKSIKKRLENSIQNEKELKYEKISFKSGSPKGELIESVLSSILYTAECILSLFVDGLLYYLAIATSYIILGIVVVALIVFKILKYIVEYLYIVLLQLTKSIPFVGSLIVKKKLDFPKVFEDIKNNIHKLSVYSDEMSDNKKKAKGFVKSDTIKKSKIEKIIAAYISLWLAIASTGLIVLCRGIVEIIRSILNTESYTAFAMGLASIFGCIIVYASSFYVSPADPSMDAYSGVFWPGFDMSTGLPSLVFFFFSIVSLAYLCRSVGDSETETEQIKTEKNKRDKFLFVITKAFIAARIFFLLGAALNVLTAGPSKLMETVPVALCHIMIIEFIYDAESALHEKSINESRQMKSILASSLLVSFLFFTQRNSLSTYQAYGLLASVIITHALPNYTDKASNKLVPEKKSAIIRQSTYFILRAILIRIAMILLISNPIDTILRPFLYAKGLIVGAKTLCMIEARSVIF